MSSSGLEIALAWFLHTLQIVLQWGISAKESVKKFTMIDRHPSELQSFIEHKTIRLITCSNDKKLRLFEDQKFSYLQFECTYLLRYIEFKIYEWNPVEIIIHYTRIILCFTRNSFHLLMHQRLKFRLIIKLTGRFPRVIKWMMV